MMFAVQFSNMKWKGNSVAIVLQVQGTKGQYKLITQKNGYTAAMMSL